jgi:hypothetical protein
LRTDKQATLIMADPLAIGWSLCPIHQEGHY